MRISISLLFVSALVMGCSHGKLSITHGPTSETFIVSTKAGDVEKPLAGGETVNGALSELGTDKTAVDQPVVLMRRGPDGLMPQRIDCAMNGNLFEAKNNLCLRNGDRLIVAVPGTQPNGLARPSMPGIPVSN